MADQKYTKAQLQKLVDNQFAKHDVNADGQLDHDEAENLLKEVHGRFGSAEWNQDAFEAAFTQADTNGNGHISKDELHAFLLARATKNGLMADEE